MIKAVFITNIPSPYRVDFFAYLQKHYPEYEFHIIFSGAGTSRCSSGPMASVI